MFSAATPRGDSRHHVGWGGTAALRPCSYLGLRSLLLRVSAAVPCVSCGLQQAAYTDHNSHRCYGLHSTHRQAATRQQTMPNKGQFTVSCSGEMANNKERQGGGVKSRNLNWNRSESIVLAGAGLVLESVQFADCKSGRQLKTTCQKTIMLAERLSITPNTFKYRTEETGSTYVTF